MLCMFVGAQCLLACKGNCTTLVTTRDQVSIAEITGKKGVRFVTNDEVIGDQERVYELSLNVFMRDMPQTQEL